MAMKIKLTNMLRGEERKKIKKKQIRKVKQRQIKITAVGKEQLERQAKE